MDPNTFANYDAVRITKFHLDWNVDFNSKTISGHVTLFVETLKHDCSDLVLDSRELNIEKIVTDDGSVLEFVVEEKDLKFGSAVLVSLPQNFKSGQVTVHYQTSPCSTALQWLSPEQTAGKLHPYVFSQCQAIHCRSLVPIHDTPAVKCPYSARVRVNSGFTALMSALQTGRVEDAEFSTYSFDQPMPVPSYLVALVVGQLEGRDISHRIRIWSEASVVDSAAREFEETEKMLQTAEQFCGEYRWQKYDLVVLPPSFPYGGMENPCLTFVTPTLLAGDKSAVDVVVHEITHSWTGNLVTNCSWEHFWLNEGFTMFIERKLLGILFGQPTRHFSAIEGWNSLHDCITNTFKPCDPVTSLVVNLKDVDPDDAFSTVPYEKGHTFLWCLEETVGGPEKFDPFLRAYIAEFSGKSINTDDFKRFLYSYFSDIANKLDALHWDAWLYAPGMPAYKPKFDDSLSRVCCDLQKRWSLWDLLQECPFSTQDLETFSSNQIVQFLERIYLLPVCLPIAKLEKMALLYSLWDKKNCEIRLRWLRIGIRSRWKAAVAPALKFVTEQGRMKFLRPIYRELYRWEGEVRQLAIENFLANESSMMHVAAHTVRHDLCLDKQAHQ